MSSQTAACPICNETFPMRTINKHIDACLLKVDEGSTGSQTSDSEDGVKGASSSNTELESSAHTNRPTERTAMQGKQENHEQVDNVTCKGQDKKRKNWNFLLQSSSKKSKVDTDLKQGKKIKMGSLTAGSRSDKLSEGSLIAATSKIASTPSMSSSSVTTPSTFGILGSSKKPSTKTEFQPLAQRMRPRNFTGFVGQEKAVGSQSMLRRLLEADKIPSMILWGPPGCGKTTLAYIVAERAKASRMMRFVQMSATTANVSTVKEAITAASNEQRMTKRKTILFIDEIHRFNKTQQDTFLPHVEDGTITLIGATTENPSFKINNALLSRCRVVVLDKLSTEDLLLILKRATNQLGVELLKEGETSDGRIKAACRSDNDQEGTSQSESRCPVYIENTALSYLANLCDGDARSALNTLQEIIQSQAPTLHACNNADQSQSPLHRRGSNDLPGLRVEQGNNEENEVVVISTDHVKEALQRSHVMYDREGEEHYNCISALHKSMRGSDANAALYWLGRMLIGGEDPLFIARRLIAFSSEDVGLADPQALTQAVSTHQACQFLGRPACEVVLAQCVLYLSRAPKSPMVEGLLMTVKKYIKEYEGPVPGVPLHLRPGSTQLMRDLGYGKGYVHSAAAGDQGFLPECMRGVDFFKDSKEVFT